MMRSTLGAPLGGTMRGGHQGVESLALSLITPPNFGGGGGSCFPSMVVVALGEPNWPVTCCATTGVTANMATSRNAAASATAAPPREKGTRDIHSVPPNSLRRVIVVLLPARVPDRQQRPSRDHAAFDHFVDHGSRNDVDERSPHFRIVA